MSAFSERLNKYVDESGFSKNALIAACQVNRSTFFQCLNGKRLPTDEFFETLLQALQLSPGEEGKLRKCYYIAQIGESVYRSRINAQRCLDTLASLSGEVLPQIYQFKGETQLTTPHAPLQGENQVYQELCHLVRAEMFLPEPKIDLFLPQNSRSFFEYLKALYRGSGEKVVRLRQLVQFAQKKGEKTKDSLEFFSSILFFLASNCTGYEAYYYYTEADFSNAVGVLYPYSVITSTGVLLLNEKMDRGLFSTAPDILSACRCQFEDAIRESKQFYTPFLGYKQTVEFALDHWSGSCARYQYFATPCFGMYLPDEILERYCPAGMEKIVYEYFNRVKAGQDYTSFCCERGLMRFARDGIMDEYPIGLIPPLNPEDRVAILKEMLYRRPKNARLYLIDENKQAISDEFVFSLSKGKRISSYRRAMPKLRMYCFQEQNLLDAFMDYFEALTQSKYVLPQSEVERVLYKAIVCANSYCTHGEDHRAAPV